ncbi:uncharacterized protein LOC118745459 [Rhagoletis pomonella]|uniref:uncharacterized protein LOC118745459 n=1 Tax=Rhagoletis pomonella TaxID=28610 RepID=UPI0017813A9F|nr:uncharacterized protein LOC118745459 [Rhagoletis pomonella]
MTQFLQVQRTGMNSSTTQVENVAQNVSLPASGSSAVANNDGASVSNSGAVASNEITATRIYSNEYSSTNINTRHASVKEIANTLPEFDPISDKSITVEQFIDHVNKVIEAYRWDEKFLLLAIYTRLNGVARMWLDASPVLHTTWADFANALKSEFGTTHDEAEIHFLMSNATRRPKERINEYCFRVSSIGVRYNLSESAIIRYIRVGLKHRELQQSIAAMKFNTVKQMRDAIEDYFVNRGGLYETKNEQFVKRDEQKAKVGEAAKQRESTRAQLKCYNCSEAGHFSNKCPLPQKRQRCTTCNKVHPNDGNCDKAANLRRLGVTNCDECFNKTIYIQSKPYTAFVDTGSQCSIIRESVAERIKAERRKCCVKIKGICGGVRILNEAIIVDIIIDEAVITAQVYIADDNLVQQDVLLGQDVIVNANVTMKIDSGRTIFENKQLIQQPVISNCKFSKLLSNFSNEAERVKTQGLLENFAEVFSTGLDGIGKTDVVEASIELESSQTVAQVPYRIPEPKRSIVNSMIDELLQHDIVTKSTSEYASPVVVIKKQSGGDRLCIDYRRLNKLMKKENFPVPNIEER